MAGMDPASPNMETMFEAMRRENERLRNRLSDTECDYIRIKRLNEIYREELIEHRRRVCYTCRHFQKRVFRANTLNCSWVCLLTT